MVLVRGKWTVAWKYWSNPSSSGEWQASTTKNHSILFLSGYSCYKIPKLSTYEFLLEWAAVIASLFLAWKVQSSTLIPGHFDWFQIICEFGALESPRLGWSVCWITTKIPTSAHRSPPSTGTRSTPTSWELRPSTQRARSGEGSQSAKLPNGAISCFRLNQPVQNCSRSAHWSLVPGIQRHCV